MNCWTCKDDIKTTEQNSKIIKISYKLDGGETTAIICSRDSCLQNFYKWIYHPDFCPCPRCDGMILGLGCLNCSSRIKNNAKWTIGSSINKDKQICMRLFCSDLCETIYGKVFEGICGICAETKVSVVCQQCKKVKYCSETCLKKDAERHSKSCVQMIANGKRPHDARTEVLTNLICANCNSKSNTELSRCAGCKKTYYCSKECQKEHWKKEHKIQCKKLVNESN